MSGNTAIEWTDSSWPVVTGCTHISAGCDHCYAAKLTSGRLKHLPEYAGLAEHGRFNGIVRCLPDRLDWPLKWRKPRRIFVSDMADLFHDAVPDEHIARVFAVMAVARRHTFQVLTKRHGRMRSLLSDGGRWPDLLRDGLGWLVDHADAPMPPGDFDAAVSWAEGPWQRGENVPPLANVWLGVSVEDQKWADIRIPALIDTPAAVRFLSCEPLLGPIDLSRWIGHIPGADCACSAGTSARSAGPVWATQRDGEADDRTGAGDLFTPGVGRTTDDDRGGLWRGDADRLENRPGRAPISWLIAGGESGPGARPMLPDWPRSLRDQCHIAGVPFFFKQWGAWSPTGWIGIGGTDPNRGFVGKPVNEHGAREEIARTSKKLAGRVLDGRTWDEFPAAAESVPA